MDKVKSFFKESLIYIIIIVIVIVIKMYVVSPVRVNGTSMNNTLEDKDIMVLDKIGYRFNKIKRFDIVVIDLGKEKIIKRVIGLPGEKIEYKNNVLYVNGKIVKENFSHKVTEDFNISSLSSTTVPNNTYFVLGDNRTNSMDSRIIGFIPKNKILGHASLIIYPISRFGVKNS